MTATLEPSVGAGAKAVAGTSPADVIRRAKEAGVQIVDVRFTDSARHLAAFLDSVEGARGRYVHRRLGIDGSSIRGFQAINESDMLLLPDPASAFVDPCLQVPTLSLTCDVRGSHHPRALLRDPRYVARKAEAFLKKSGVATTAYFGPEAEFYIFNSVRFDQNAHEGYYHIDSERRHLELRHERSGQSGSPAAPQGRLLPGATDRPAAGSSLQDHAGDDRVGHRGGSPPP